MTMLKKPSHPGEILKSEFLEPLELSEGALAKRLGVPRTRIERLVRGTTSVTLDTAFRLARFFGTTPQFWLNMQTNHDIANASIDVSSIEPFGAAYCPYRGSRAQKHWKGEKMNTFSEDLIQSLNEALAHAKGELRVAPKKT